MSAPEKPPRSGQPVEPPSAQAEDGDRPAFLQRGADHQRPADTSGTAAAADGDPKAAAPAAAQGGRAAAGQDPASARRQGGGGAQAGAATGKPAQPLPAAQRARRQQIMQQRRAAEQKARPQQPVRPVAGLARPKARHLAIALSFVLLVVAPVAVSGWYLYARAADQFASFVGFSVRSESGPTGSELLGGLGSLIGATSSSGSDTDILYKFIQSRDLVERVNKRMDLRAIWSKPEGDPVFSFRGNDSLESLLAEWERKVRVYYDNGMIDLRVLSFDPTDSRQIAQAILDEGTLLINQLNDVAREDSLRYARTELDDALARLKQARQAVSEFRNRHQLVDPSADVQGQVGVVTSLNQQLAEELVSLGMLQANAQANDPRIEQTQLRINVIRDQIDAERRKFGSDSESGEVLSDIVGQYESLSIDRQFAEQTYTAALAAYDTARAEANRQSRYLAAYVKPTLAQEAEYPERAKLLLILGGFLMLLWVIGVLIYYSLRDRR